MALGNGIVYLSLVLAIGGMITSLLRVRGWDRRFLLYSRFITFILFFLITGIVVYYYYIFLTSDMTYSYVYQYSSVDLEAKYKFSAVLAGLAGSLLFWIWWIIIPWFIEEVRAMGRKIDTDTLDIARLATFGVLAVLIYVLSLYDMFALTPQSALDANPDGQGLNALLQTDLMIIHPPVVFVAYGAMVIPFAAAFAYLLTGHKDWTRLSIFWSRFGWLFLTAGIGVGALWAYTVLGWGGYWAWDPIETSSLLPWFLLTAFLHAQLIYSRKGDYPILAPLLGITSFILVIFATFSTRAAGLWASVHSYGDADLSLTPWERFQDIMENIPSVRVYVWFMIITFVLMLIIVFRVYDKKRKREEEEERYYTLAELIEDDMLMFGTIIMLVLTTIVTLFILMSGMDGLGPEDFDRPIGFLAMIGVLLLFVCLMWRDLGRTRVAQIAGATALAAVMAALIFRDNMAVAATFPILIVGLVGAVYKTGKSFNRKRLWPSLKLVSAHIIHVSVVLIILGYIGSSYLREESLLTLEVNGPSQDFEGYSFSSTELRSGPDYIWTEIEVDRGDRNIGTERPGATYVNGQWRSEVAVLWTISEDIYLIYGNSTSSGGINFVNVSVTILPFMNALWLGMYLMMFGIAARVFFEFMIRRKRSQRELVDDDTEDLEVEPEEDDSDYDEDGDYQYEDEEVEEEDSAIDEEKRDDSYYEDMLEEELKRI
jgi:cytochrome c-type biogenesis protein CcmF